MKTIEEKAKAYDEAFERAKDVKNGPSPHDSSVATVEYIFPELCESKDERNIDTIFNCLYQCCDTGFISGTQRDNALAWLEKQKEQKPAEPISKETCLNEMLKNGQISLSDYLSLTKEQKPAWSEEEERILKGVIGKIDHDQTYGVSKAEMLSFLKRVRPQVNPIVAVDAEQLLKILPKRQEWSEEDERKIRQLVALLKSSKEKCMAAFYKDIDECIAWVCDLRPSWKPSEEQMRGLKYFLDYHRPQRNAGTTAWKEFDSVDSLYNDLLKLK